MTPPTLTTARLELRPVQAEDLDDLAGLYADPDVMRYIGDGRPRTRADSATRLEIMLDHWRKHGFGFFTIRRSRLAAAVDVAAVPLPAEIGDTPALLDPLLTPKAS